MAEVLSKSQIDRLGAKLRSQEFGEAELRMLDEYRYSFRHAYDVVAEKVQRAIGADVSVSWHAKAIDRSRSKCVRRCSIFGPSSRRNMPTALILP